MKLIINNFYLMKINTTFLLILLVTRMSSVNLYFHHQDITPNATVGIFDFTEDLSVIAIGNSNNRYEILTHTDFTYVISGASAGGYEVDLTNDGAFMLVSKF